MAEQKVRVRLRGYDIELVDQAAKSIVNAVKKSGAKFSGPIPLPTKRLKLTTRKSPCGDGTATFDRFEMRIHKRIIDLPANDRVLHAIMRTTIPPTVNIKIKIID